MPPTPKTIASYEIEHTLGKGGMGVVHLARQPSLERLVVVKALRRDLVGDERSEERFRREARAAAAVHHPNVVAIYDCFSWRGQRYISQEYVDGVDLSTVLGTRPPPPRLVALAALEIARGLEEIHARGIVHRDLKPSNVLVGRGGEVKIADFGIAFDGKEAGLTQTGQAVGTPSYMSPEQLRGERVDVRSDVFGFGVLLYELLAGVPPYRADPEQGPSLLRLMETRRREPLRRKAPGTPRWLARLVADCLQPRPGRRPGDAGVLRRELERRLGTPSPADARREIGTWLWDQGILGEEDDDATRPRMPAPAPRRRRLGPWAAAAAAGATLLAAAATSWVRVTELLELAARP